MVFLAGENATIKCYYRQNETTLYWHFYGLNSGGTPCGFNNVFPGISLCLFASKTIISPASDYDYDYDYDYEYRLLYYYRPTSRYYGTVLTITNVQLSDAGTYTCGDHNPYNRSVTRTVIVGVIGKCIL